MEDFPTLVSEGILLYFTLQMASLLPILRSWSLHDLDPSGG
jgi:hypothetical protein